MLSSVALQILYYLLLGPWKDPMGFNFPQTTMFQDAALFPPIIFGFRLNYSLIIPLLFTVFVWIYMERHFGGFQLVVGGLAPSAATYAGYSSSGAVWKSLLIAGFAAGIAGMSEVAGPMGSCSGPSPRAMGIQLLSSHIWGDYIRWVYFLPPSFCQLFT